VAKLLNGAKLTDQSPRWKRLEEVIEVCRSFNHAHVVRVIDSGRTLQTGYPFFVMPFYSGGSLQENRAEFASPVAIGLSTFQAPVNDVTLALQRPSAMGAQIPHWSTQDWPCYERVAK